MMARGLLKEVDGLLAQGVSPAAQAMQGIGYKEVIDGILNGVPWDVVKETVKQHTRNYAKRQLTYFRRMQNLTILPHTNPRPPPLPSRTRAKPLFRPVF